MKKRLKISLILTFIAFAGIVVCPMHIKAANQTITFNDKNMYEAMRKELKDQYISSDDNNQSITVTDEVIGNTTAIHLDDENIIDLSGLEYFTNLELVDIQDNKITSIEKVPGEHLKQLSISNIEDIKDINLIENYSNLYILEVDGSNLEEVPDAVKKISSHLTYLEWTNGVLKSTAWVKDFPKLTSLRLDNNQISSLENISTLSGSLTSLDLSGNKIENIDEIGSCIELYSLDISDNNVKNLNGISRLGLVSLNASNNNITDISSLNLGKLSSLDVSNNCISDFDIIKDVAVDKSYKISGQLIKIDINSGDKADVPAMVEQSKNFFNAKDIQLLNCIISDGKCEIDESVTYARIKINDGAMKDSMVYFNVTNVQVPGITGKTINFTKTQIIVIFEVVLIMIISLLIIAKIKRKKN